MRTDWKKIYHASTIFKNTPPNKPMDKEEITMGIRKYFRLDDNENITYQNLWNAAKAKLTGKF